jgi:hypothetical protein
MKKLLKMMKPGDLILLVLLVILSFLPVLIFSINTMTSDVDHYTAVISYDGEPLHEMALIDDGETETYEYTSDDGNQNIVVREGTEVHMHDANCTDQLCVRQGTVEEVGETIVCLPHRFVVEVTTENPDEEPEIDVIS